MSGYHWVFRFLCHQIPSRSPEYLGETFPVCFRCAGLYGGLCISYLFAVFQARLWQRFPARKLAWLAAILTFPLQLDAWGNALGLWQSPALLRACTGMAAGIAIPFLLLPLVRLADSRPLPVRNVRSLIGPLCAGTVFVAMLVRPVSRIAFEWLSYACVLGLISLLVNVCFAWRERMYG